ncbi:MAG: hypothetical protein M1823_004721 [Watsoniomyces obsoletus]|nr:MAG: hypothetical protein M1823_004721 [Watsoniomyces obsoletus]
MSLPGLQVVVPTVDEPAATIVHELPRGSEWRFEVAFGVEVQVKLLTGTAEIFGTELAIQQPYTFTGTKAAIYTWHGCRLEVTGECSVEYLAEETPMISYANVHFALEKLRQEAFLQNSEGPRVVVVGPDHAGKTSLVKILTSYATKTGREPLIVNLDFREGMLSLPGSLTAASFPSIMDVEVGWGSSPMSGPSQIPVKLPLVYFYGRGIPDGGGGDAGGGGGAMYYQPLISRLALAVSSKLNEDEEAKVAGCIVDTPGSIITLGGKQGYEHIQHIVSEFSINVILVLGNERLYSDMARRFEGSSASTDEAIKVVKLARSGGCVDREEEYMKQLRQVQIREYFFGDIKRTLSPHMQQLEFDSVVIFKIHEESELLASLKPGGHEDEEIEETPIFDLVEPSLLMQNCILAMVYAQPDDSHENIRDASVMGFLYVAEVDESKKKLKVLSPTAGRLPNRPLIWGSWPEPAMNLVG